MFLPLKTFLRSRQKALILGAAYFLLTSSLSLPLIHFTRLGNLEQKNQTLMEAKADVEKDLIGLHTDFASVSANLETFTSQDINKLNQDLTTEVESLKTAYTALNSAYQKIGEYKAKDPAAAKNYETEFSEALKLLADNKPAEAKAKAVEIYRQIDTILNPKPTATPKPLVPTPLPVETNNNPPASGYSRQNVQLDIGTYTVSLVAANLASTKVIIDTASESTCFNDCPVLPLGTYVSRSGAIAGVNGSYFCPASYPTCAGKTNSFDTLLMNKHKVYFNVDNNLHSVVPLAVFSGTSVQYMQSQSWGKSTAIDGAIANQPLLLSGGNVVFGGDGDPKKGSKSYRGFLGNTGSTVYIGIVHNATVAEAAWVLKALGVQYALNLDGGGSAALWSGGYKIGPGRNIPNAVLLVPR